MGTGGVAGAVSGDALAPSGEAALGHPSSVSCAILPFV